MFRSTTEHLLANCPDDVELFHKHVAPGQRVRKFHSDSIYCMGVPYSLNLNVITCCFSQGHCGSYVEEEV